MRESQWRLAGKGQREKVSEEVRGDKVQSVDTGKGSSSSGAGGRESKAGAEEVSTGART